MMIVCQGEGRHWLAAHCANWLRTENTWTTSTWLCVASVTSYSIPPLGRFDNKASYNRPIFFRSCPSCSIHRIQKLKELAFAGLAKKGYFVWFLLLLFVCFVLFHLLLGAGRFCLFCLFYLFVCFGGSCWFKQSLFTFMKIWTIKIILWALNKLGFW